LWFFGTPSVVDTNIRVCDEALLTMFKGHKYLYERGVLHRDISPGNILIKWRPGSEADQPSTSGCLIDLDHGKRGTPYSTQAQAPPADEDLNALGAMFTRTRVETDVTRQALDFFPAEEEEPGPAFTYIKAAIRCALESQGLTKEQVCTSQHLRWKPVRPRRSPFLSL
jgi:serine/threonine protein kinase